MELRQFHLAVSCDQVFRDEAFTLTRLGLLLDILLSGGEYGAELSRITCGCPLKRMQIAPERPIYEADAVEAMLCGTKSIHVLFKTVLPSDSFPVKDAGVLCSEFQKAFSLSCNGIDFSERIEPHGQLFCTDVIDFLSWIIANPPAWEFIGYGRYVPQNVYSTTFDPGPYSRLFVDESAFPGRVASFIDRELGILPPSDISQECKKIYLEELAMRSRRITGLWGLRRDGGQSVFRKHSSAMDLLMSFMRLAAARLTVNVKPQVVAVAENDFRTNREALSL